MDLRAFPAVVLERKRAEDIYNQLKQQAIDPGILQMGERGSEEAKRSSVFSARIVPIPPPTERSGWRLNITSPFRWRI